jgi:acetyl esterase/lipase
MHKEAEKMKARRWSIVVVSLLLAVLSCAIVSVVAAQPSKARHTLLKLVAGQAKTANRSEQTSSTYTILSYTIAYTEPFLIDDLRYPDKTCFNIRTLTVSRAFKNNVPVDNQPVVFFVHGGGWTDGYMDWYDFVARSFTGELGWVTVVIDYRLTSDQVLVADPACQGGGMLAAPDAPVPGTKAAWYPDNIEDVADAFRWVVDNIQDYGGNPNQIVLFGHSAGGHLVSLLATHPDYEALRPAIKGVVSLSGAYSIADLNMLFFGPVVDQTWSGGHQNNDAELDEASPATYVTAGVTLPPFYLLHCQVDLPSLPEQAVAFEASLEDLSLLVAADYLPGYNHVSEMTAIEYITATPTLLIAGFVRDTLWPYQVYTPLVVK